MEKVISEPSFALATVDAVGLIGAVVYFQSQIQQIRGEIKELKECLLPLLQKEEEKKSAGSCPHCRTPEGGPAISKLILRLEDLTKKMGAPVPLAGAGEGSGFNNLLPPASSVEAGKVDDHPTEESSSSLGEDEDDVLNIIHSVAEK